MNCYLREFFTKLNVWTFGSLKLLLLVEASIETRAFLQLSKLSRIWLKLLGKTQERYVCICVIGWLSRFLGGFHLGTPPLRVSSQLTGTPGIRAFSLAHPTPQKCKQQVRVLDGLVGYLVTL